MSRTAVGLFQNAGIAAQVATDLEASSFPRSEIRTLSEPLDLGGTGTLGTPRLDFHVRLERELTAMGATVGEANAYGEGVRRGGVLVFASGSEAQADEAIGIMNRLGAMQLEELGGSTPVTGLKPDDAPSGVKAHPVHLLTAGNGARLFVWVKA